jgi:hypothetical protein
MTVGCARNANSSRKCGNCFLTGRDSLKCVLEDEGSDRVNFKVTLPSAEESSTIRS